MPIDFNIRGNNRAVVRLVNASNTITVNSLAVDANDVIWGMDISQVYWTGQWSIYRGTTLVLDLPAAVAGKWNFAQDGMTITANNNQSIVANTTSSNGATLILELKKLTD